MHIHASFMNMNSATLYSAAGADKAATAQRAADVRKRLMKSPSAMEGPSRPDEAFILGQWMNSQPGQPQNQDQQHATLTGKVLDFG